MENDPIKQGVMFSLHSGDLSRTLKEGRFWSQVQKMVDWKKEFMTFDFPCELFYIIEGETDYSDRGQGPGRNPTPTQIKVR